MKAFAIQYKCEGKMNCLSFDRDLFVYAKYVNQEYSFELKQTFHAVMVMINHPYDTEGRVSIQADVRDEESACEVVRELTERINNTNCDDFDMTLFAPGEIDVDGDE